MIGRLVIENAAIATVDAAGTEHVSGHVVVTGDRITAVGPGPAPVYRDDLPTRRVDGTGCLATPGLVNSHHHLYQWATRGLATGEPLFGWLTALYRVWAHLDAGIVHATTRAGLAWLALGGCTTSTDHHYVFPHGAP